MGKITRWLVSKGAHSFGGLPGHSHPVADDGTIDCAECATAHGLPVAVVAPSAAKPPPPPPFQPNPSLITYIERGQRPAAGKKP